MKKNITRLLQKGNIKPRDRVKLLVADLASKERDGKSLLTEGDKYALSEGWTPKNNEEVKEYNRFNEGWKNVAYAEMDAQTIYLTATNSFLRAVYFITVISNKSKFSKDTKTIKQDIANKTADELLKKYNAETIRETAFGEALKEEATKDGKALELILDYIGFEIEPLIYFYAYELADKGLKEDILALYPDANTESDYLLQEEIIYKLFDGKESLNQEAKEKLADLIIEECFNDYTGKWTFNSYFAGIPMLDVLGKWGIDYNKKATRADDFIKHLKNDSYKKESEEREDLYRSIEKEITKKLTIYAKENKREIKDLIKETVLKWLDEDLLEEHQPIFKSDEKVTCNEKDTRLTHKEVFKKWLEVKKKATETIQGLIEKGELKTETKTTEVKELNLFNEKTGQTSQDRTRIKKRTIITGKSLYQLEADYQFAKDFKKQAEDLKVLGAFVLFLRDCSFVKDYSTLLAFEILFKELSKTFDTDLTYSIKNWKTKFKKDLVVLKMELIQIIEGILKTGYESDRVYYLTDSFIEELLKETELDHIEPDQEGKVKIYASKIKEVLLDDFKNPFENEK